MKLAGITVLDLSQFLPGPHLTMMLGDHGAEVVKVESPGGGEPARHAPYRIGGHSVWFRNTHRGKKSIVLDLKSIEGREDFLALADSTDVIVESFRPGVAARLGVDYEVVARRNPRIVYASISAFGQTGTESLRPAHDAAVEALAGAISLNLDPDGRPLMPHLPVADISSSMMALAGILMALYRREQTGRGDYIDIAMQDSVMSWMAHCIGPVFAEDRAPVVGKERYWGGHSFNHIYATKGGGHIVLGGMEEKFVRNLLRLLQREDLADAALTPPGDNAQLLVKAFLASAFLQRTRDEWEVALSSTDVCFAPVLDLHEACGRPQPQERGMILRDTDGNLHIGNPIKLREEPGRLDLSVPGLGEHTEELLARSKRRS